MAEKLTRSTIEAYVGIAIAVFVGVVPMNWQTKVGLILVLCVICIDIILRCSWAGKFRLFQKIAISVVVILGLLALSYYPIHEQYIDDNVSAISGDLFGAGEAVKNAAPPMIVIDDTESKFISDPSFSGPFIKVFDSNFLVERGKDGRLISTTVRDGDGHIVVTVDKNHWKVFPPFCQDKNYTSDGRKFEVMDSSLHVVLQLVIMNDQVKIQGEWWDNQGDGTRLLKSPNTNKAAVAPLNRINKHNEELIQPIFEYPSREHWRELKK